MGGIACPFRCSNRLGLTHQFHQGSELGERVIRQSGGTECRPDLMNEAVGPFAELAMVHEGGSLTPLR